MNRLIAQFLLVCLCLVLAGCPSGIKVGTKPMDSHKLLDTPSLQAEADQAYQERNYSKSELYYLRLLERPDLAPASRPNAVKRLAESALRAGHYHQALLALDDWALADAHAMYDWRWNEFYIGALAGLNRFEDIEIHKNRLMGNRSLPWEVRSKSAVAFSEAYADTGSAGRAFRVLEDFYSQAPDAASRGEMEKDYFLHLSRSPNVDSLAMAITPGAEGRFPYALVLFEKARRDAVSGPDREAALARMKNIIAGASLSDKLSFGDVIMSLGGGGTQMGLALAVPVTGRYQDVGRKILRGASAAQWIMGQNGIDVEIKVINTDAAGWVERLEYLPSNFSIVGGPIRTDSMDQIVTSGTLKEKAFFTFLPRLNMVAEGIDAWRFFPSRRDEVRSLVSMAVDQLGISQVGVLYPDEEFGQGMSRLFMEEAALGGAQVVSTQSYPPKDHPEWSAKVAELLGVPARINKKGAPLGDPKFGAVFLPDGWAQAQMLVPNFLYYDAADMVFLGPDLWSRSLDSNPEFDDSYFRLAVCPGAWWPETPGGMALVQALESEGLGEADFWVALGFDFVNLAGAVGTLPEKWSSDSVNQRLKAAVSMNFSMAPLSWDENGVASQQLYQFSPTTEGKVLANPDDIRQGVARAKARRAKRRQLYYQQSR